MLMRNFHQSHPPTGFDQSKSIGNSPALALLDLLHGQNHNAQSLEPPTQHMAYKNLSQMPSANELEMHWRQNSVGSNQGNADYQKMMQQIDYKNNFLAGKSVVEVLGVLAQAQMRQKQQQQQQLSGGYQNQWGITQARPILKSN